MLRPDPATGRALVVDAMLVLIEEERRQLALSPAEEAAELQGLYEAKGLSSVSRIRWRTA